MTKTTLMRPRAHGGDCSFGSVGAVLGTGVVLGIEVVLELVLVGRGLEIVMLGAVALVAATTGSQLPPVGGSNAQWGMDTLGGRLVGGSPPIQ